MQEADKLRQRGLQQNDQRLLSQAEQYERRALALYQQRVQQFEKRNLTANTRPQATRTPTNSRRSTATPRTRSAPSRSAPQRSSRRTSSWWRWSRIGRR
jgi:hypothetical protein